MSPTVKVVSIISLRRTVEYLRVKQQETLAVDAVERKLILANT